MVTPGSNGRQAHVVESSVARCKGGKRFVEWTCVVAEPQATGERAHEAASIRG
jgi:hypothetical protein